MDSVQPNWLSQLGPDTQAFLPALAPALASTINMVLNAFVLCLVCTATSFVNSKTTFGPNQVGVNFCCGEDERLEVDEEEPGKTNAKCVQIGNEEEGSSLEERQVWVGGEDGDGGEMKSLKLLEVRNLCLHIPLLAS